MGEAGELARLVGTRCRVLGLHIIRGRLVLVVIADASVSFHTIDVADRAVCRGVEDRANILAQRSQKLIS